MASGSAAAMISSAVAASNIEATATPASTIRPGSMRALRPAPSTSTAANATIAPPKAPVVSPNAAPPMPTNTITRAERRAGRDAEQVRVGERVAHRGLHDGPDQRQPGADGGGQQHPRQPDLPHDRVLRRRRVGPEPEVLGDDAPHVGGADARWPDRDRRQHRHRKQQHEQTEHRPAPDAARARRHGAGVTPSRRRPSASDWIPATTRTPGVVSEKGNSTMCCSRNARRSRNARLFCA